MAIELEKQSIPELLVEATGEPVEKFEYDRDEHPIPELDDLESVDPEEVYDERFHSPSIPCQSSKRASSCGARSSSTF